MEEKKVKNKNVGVYIFIIFLTLIILSLVGYIIYDRVLLGNDDTTVIEKTEEQDNNVVEFTEIEAKEIVRAKFERVLPYMDSTNSYCGDNYGSSELIDDRTGNHYFMSYDFHSYDDLYNYLQIDLTDDAMKSAIHIISKDNYIEKDGNLYCSNFGKGGDVVYSEYIYSKSNIDIEEINEKNIKATIKAGYYDADGESINYKQININLAKIDQLWQINKYESEEI